jgi:hypothetical protein
MPRCLLPLFALLPLLASSVWAEAVLDVAFPVSGGRYQIHPLKGMRFHPPQTEAVEAFFLGEVGDDGPVSLVVLKGGDAGELPRSSEELVAYQKQVAAGLEEARSLGGRLLPPRPGMGQGIEMEIEMTQFIGGQPQRVIMLQRQLALEGQVYHLTVVCLKRSLAGLRGVLVRSLDSFSPRARSPRSPDERLRIASELLLGARLEEAERMAAGMPLRAPFLPRVGALRLRMSANLAMRRTRAARDLIRPYLDLWRRDRRPFSAHYTVLLRRGVTDYLQRLHEIDRLKLDVGAQAALSQVALVAWAGPVQMVPPHLTEKQDHFFAALRKVGEAQGPALAAAWKALAPSFQSAAQEVEGFLRKASRKGENVTPGSDDYLWLESALYLPLVQALREGDLDRFRKVLEMFSGLDPAASSFYSPSKLLEQEVRTLGTGEGASFQDYAYRIWQTAGTGLYRRTQRLLEAKGLEGLFEQGVKLSAPRR